MQLGEISDPDAPNNKKTGISVSANSGLINQNLVAGVGFEPTTFGL
jgi:hypothetical protein